MEPKIRFPQHLSTLVFLAAVITPQVGYTRSATAPPPLPAPTGAVVRVTSEPQLQDAVHHLQSNTTILVAPGTYRLTSTLQISGTLTDVSLRGETGRRDDVVLVGAGLTHASSGLVPYAIATGGTVQGVEIADLTIGDVYERAILFGRGTTRPHVYDVRFVDAGAPIVDAQPGVDGGIVEYSVFEYTTTAREAGTAGLAIDGGAAWIVRHNLFRNIVGPSWQLAGPAILARDGARDTLVDGNTIVNCSVGVALGLANHGGTDHRGGLVRNNMIARANGVSGGPGIVVADSANTQVVNNTVLLSGTYGTPIEYQFAGAHDVVVVNNLLDGAVWARDGATGVESHNVTDASPDMFTDASSGDLHLTARAVTAIDRGLTMPDVTDDWDGDPRPRGRAFDIGADELGIFTTRTKDSKSSLTLTGKVTTSTGAPMPGVTISLTGSATQIATSDSAGAYTLTSLPSAGNYTVTATLAGYAFNPSKFTYNNLTLNHGGDNFVGSVSLATAPGGGAGSSTPTVSLSTLATFTAPATVTLGATVFDSTRTVTQVTFNADSSAIATVTTNPYTFTWSGVPAGTYSLSATAQFNQGDAVASAPISITVNASGSAATASVALAAITWPSSGRTFAAPASLAVQASGSAPAGLARLDVYAGSTLVGSGTSSPFSVLWSDVAAGTYALTAVTTDATGATTQSAPVTVSVTSPSGNLPPDPGAQGNPGNPGAPPPPAAPVAAIIWPSSESTFSAPANLTVQAAASAAAGLARIDVYAGSTLIGSGGSSPVSAQWRNVPAGNYSLTAVVTDALGVTAQSAPVTLTVVSAAIPVPVAAVTWPSIGNSFTAPANITVQATGSSAAGLTSLAVYAGATLIGSGGSSPIAVPWSNVAAGTYSLTAVATDTTGVSVRSAPVSVSVAAPIAPAAGDPTTWPLVQAGNLTYVGAFRLPSSSNNGAFDFGGGPMTYNPANNSLFVGNRSGQIAEVNIPAPVNSPVVSNLPFAGYMQAFADPVEGHLTDIGSVYSGLALNGLLVSGGNLYGTALIYYDANGVQTVSHYRRSLTLTTPSFSGFNAVWRPTAADTANGVSYSGTGYASGYLASVPGAWQALLGGPAISGQWGMPIITRESYGPDAIVWDPAQLGAVNGKALLYYTNTHATLGAWANTSALWGGAATAGGAALIDGTRTALFFGLNGLGAFCYGDGTANPSLAGTINPADNEGYCYDPANANKGTHGYPYAYQVWAYDLNDLAAVKAGTKQPWQVVPYATWQLDLPTPDASWYGIGGVGYDAAHQLLYVSQLRADQDGYAYRPVIHVFRIQ